METGITVAVVVIIIVAVMVWLIRSGGKVEAGMKRAEALAEPREATVLSWNKHTRPWTGWSSR